jgi:hypothetical protein
MGRDASWMYFDVPYDEPALVDLPKMGVVADVVHDLKIIQAAVNVAIDAQNNTDIQTMARMLEGVSAQLEDAQQKLERAIE